MYHKNIYIIRGVFMFRRIIIILVLIGLISGIYIFQERLNIERQNNTVSIILDSDEYRLFSYEHGYDVYTVLSLLHKAGANIVSVPEETLEKLKMEGKIDYMGSADFIYSKFNKEENIVIEPGSTYVVSDDKDLLMDIKREFDLKLGREKVEKINDHLIIIKIIPDVLSEFPLYYPEDFIEKLKDMGFGISLRVTNFPSITEDTIDVIFKRIFRIKPENIIFAGEEILGYPNYTLIKKVASYIKKGKIPYGIIEFTNQKGMDFLSKYLPQFALRVHSISKDELVDMSFKKAVDRWVRGVKERNIRLLFIKPFYSSDNALKINTKYINNILQGVKKLHYNIGIASPMPYKDLNPYIIIFLSSISFLAFYFVLKALILIPGEGELEKVVYGISVLWVVVFLIFFIKNLALASKFSALTAACAFPTLSIILNEKYFKDRYREDFQSALISSISGLLEISLFTFVGALLVSFLLSSTVFMMSIDKFSGVKIAYLLPVLLVMAYLWKRKNADKYPIITTLKKELIVGDIVILGVLGIIGLLFILRSGNFSFVSIPGFEEKVRNFLEHTLIARPRTKEFLIGHPFIMLTIFWGFLRIRVYKIAFIGIGVIGQTTLINSFCHLHTPLKIALLRTFNGLWIGILVGIFYIIVFYIGYLIYKRYRKVIY